MEKSIKSESEKVWISITGYRILIILKSLIEKGRSIDELAEIVKNDPVTRRSVSKDTLRIAINTLKTAGCKIKRPSKSNGYKYELISHPFNLEITPEEEEILIKLRERIAGNLNFDEIFAVNEVYCKIAALTNDAEFIKKVKETEPLGGINKEILKEIIKPEIEGRKLNIRYKSPEFGEENIDVIAQKVNFENEKIYLKCYNLKYMENGVLNADRIIKINSISINKNEIPIDYSYEVLYELRGNALNSFKAKDYEKTVENTKCGIKVKARVENEFLFIQRLLLFGSDFKIIYPDIFKEKLADKIRCIQKGYLK